MKTYATAVPMEIEHKYFIFDDTFWIVLKEKGKRPYLCIKVNQPTEKQSLWFVDLFKFAIENYV